MLKAFLRIVFFVIIALVSGVLGLLIGMLIGGNYAEQFMFNGVRGYEATGQIGLIAGALLGLFLGSWALLKGRKQ